MIVEVLRVTIYAVEYWYAVIANVINGSQMDGALFPNKM
jgi:hypothetical protein